MKLKIVFLIFLVCGYSHAGLALEDIFNVPSSEVADKGEVFFQHESDFRAWKPEPYWESNHNTALGIGFNTELDAVLFNLKAPKTDNLSLGVGFKTVLPLFRESLPERELKLVVGEIVPISLSGKGVGDWTYSHLSGRLPLLKTRLTGGLSFGTEEIFGRNAISFIAGLEQPLMKDEKLSLVADWYSGTHDYGFLTAGLSCKVSKSLTVTAGYQIPNTKRSGHSGFIVQFETKF